MFKVVFFKFSTSLVELWTSSLKSFAIGNRISDLKINIQKETAHYVQRDTRLGEK